MLTNQAFLEKILDAFKSFIATGTSRSTAKLKPLHGAIAQDIANRLGADYIVMSQGFGNGKEARIKGRYIDKMVDITIKERLSNRNVAGIAVKFVMQNYSQNSNNYFENMLGETANIRTADCPYFQIFIMLDKLPYYKSNGVLSKWEKFTNHNMDKYCRLSHDNIDSFYHTPNKTLIYVVHVTPEVNETQINFKNDYLKFYSENAPTMELSSQEYSSIAPGGAVILNDYEKFMDKIYYTVKAR